MDNDEEKIKDFENLLDNNFPGEMGDKLRDLYFHGVRSFMVTQSFEIMKLKEKNITDVVRIRTHLGAFVIEVNGIAINLNHLDDRELIKAILADGYDIPNKVMGKVIWERLE